MDNVSPHQISEQNQAIDRLLGSYARFGVKLGLENSIRLMAALGDPQKRIPVIHVAGSNGKGSVCAYLSSIFHQAGYRVGRYTSPHLVDWTERICIDDEPIAWETLLRALQVVQSKISGDLEPTQFEVLTAAMWRIFVDQSVDIAIVEVGLGGRLDATNIIDEPLASIITSISLEHVERLGDTVEKIAFEKAGIIKTGCPLIVGHMPKEAAAVIVRRGYDLYSPMSFPQPAQAMAQGWAVYEGFELFELEEDGVALVPRSLTFELPLQGAVQLVLRSFLDSQPTTLPTHWVIGMLATKNHSEMFETLLRSGDSVYLVPVAGHKSADLAMLVELAKSVRPDLKRVWVFDDVMNGLKAATDAQNARVVLCGSLYLLGDFLGRDST